MNTIKGFYSRTGLGRDPYGLPKWRIGTVVREIDGRHTGTVIAHRNSATTVVRWDDTGWKSDHTFDELEEATR